VKTLRVALIGGPQYDGLLAALPAFEQASGCRVQVAVHLPHVELNDHLARELRIAAGSYDLISTHTKYAPSQADHLLPLDDLLSEAELADFAPRVLDLCRIDGRLMQLPRNLDARLLFYRADLIAAPSTWDEAAQQMRRQRRAGLHGFAFPGRHSGLFGTFYELLGSAGGDLFDDQQRPAFQGEAGDWALSYLHRLHTVDRVTPPDLLENWYFDEVSEGFRAGQVLMVGDWPGYYALYQSPETCAVYDRFEVAPYPAGPAGLRRSYSSSHSFAIPRAAPDPQASLALAHYLTSPAVQRREAAAGHTPVRSSLFAELKIQAASAAPGTPAARDARRLAALEATVQQYLLLPPRFARYPLIEDILWLGLRAALAGECSVSAALARMAAQVEEALI
jgi:multiple sugar transport system substrate-binding protein